MSPGKHAHERDQSSDPMPTPATTNRLLARVSAVVLGSSLAFFLGEATCRWLQIPYHPQWTPRENALGQFDSELGWSYSPSRTVHQQSDGRDVAFHFNAQGIRVPTPDTVLDASTPTILFIGCSYTMGHGLPYEETFVAQLAALSGLPDQMVNLGVQAYGSDQALLALHKFLPRFNTKMVVYTFLPAHIARNGNDDRRMWFPNATFLGTKPLFGLDGEGRLLLTRRPERYDDSWRSWLYDAVKIVALKATGRLPSYPVALTREIIKQMKVETESRGAHFILLYWDLQDFYDIDDQARKIVPVEAVFEGFEPDVLRVSTMAPPGWETMRQVQSNHPNWQMNRHVASLLAAYLHAHPRPLGSP